MVIGAVMRSGRRGQNHRAREDRGMHHRPRATRQGSAAGQGGDQAPERRKVGDGQDLASEGRECAAEARKGGKSTYP